MKDREWVKWLRTIGEMILLGLAIYGAVQILEWMTAEADSLQMFYAVNGGVVR